VTNPPQRVSLDVVVERDERRVVLRGRSFPVVGRRRDRQVDREPDSWPPSVFRIVPTTR
jgi:hypothetical protein